MLLDVPPKYFICFFCSSYLQKDGGSEISGMDMDMPECDLEMGELHHMEIPDSEQAESAGQGANDAVHGCETRVSRAKRYHVSAEWLQLSQDHPDLTILPQIVGSGLFRHPSSSFWSCVYPGRGWKTCSWNSHVLPFTSMVKCMRQLLKWHIECNPTDASAWSTRLTKLENL